MLTAVSVTGVTALIDSEGERGERAGDSCSSLSFRVLNLNFMQRPPAAVRMRFMLQSCLLESV